METIFIASKIFFILFLATALVSLVVSLFTEKKSYWAFLFSLIAALVTWSIYMVSMRY